MQRKATVAAAVLALGVALVLLWRGAGPQPPRVTASWTRTPGVLNPDVRQETIGETICVSGWTRTIRPPTEYTSSLKIEQMREYGHGGVASGYQEDHTTGQGAPRSRPRSQAVSGHARPPQVTPVG
jgi:hypothetical protein